MAIAFQNSASLGEVTATSQTVAYTCGGDILFVGIRDSGVADNFTGTQTYGGVAMTRVGIVIHTINLTTYLYVLVNPPQGSNNVVLTRDSSGAFQSIAMSYTGAKQTGQPDSSGTGTATAATSITISTTVVLSNSWLVGFISNGAGNQSAGSGTTLRQAGTNSGNGMFDSNGTVAAGSRSLIVNFDVGNAAGVICSFAPAVTAIKTVDGLAVASVKTVDGLAIASVKTVDGLA